MAKNRGAAAAVVITPALSKAALKTLVTNFTTYSTLGFTDTVENCTTTITSRIITTTTVNGFSDAVVGQIVTGTGIPLNTLIEFVNSPTSITINKLPTTATAGTLTVTLASSNVSTIKASDQLEGATLRIAEMYQPNVTQASEAPFNKTKTGSETSLQMSIADDRIQLFKLATNAIGYADDKLITMGDGSGLTVGTLQLPFRTVIIQPYVGGVVSTNPQSWYTMPNAGSESQVELSYSLQNQRSYQLTFTGYDPYEDNYRVILGDPANLP